ncbi:hypothetical protein K457DRAFT_128103 [Linnemannia elongata AG-77]|uniref:F-box domain-containing protein n=1 Tax=Linnemannia elongata AG-77 TaxID=1314771 RepID=A0A197JQF9_9FUNG|nr:hypothetical protein K457DRAFT_128103 [Linnemannia elongata AG-77]
MPSTLLSNLPSEVTELMSTFLDSHDLTQCVLVNKSWHSLFIPSLWRTLRNTDKDLRPLFLTRTFWRAFFHYHDHIRILETNDPTFVIIIARILTKLQSLTYCPTDDDVVDVPTVMWFNDIYSTTPLSLEVQEELRGYDNPIILVTLIHQNQNLRSLSISEPCFRLKNGDSDFHNIMPRILKLPSLERLEISFAAHLSPPGLPPLDDKTFEARLPVFFADFVNYKPPLGEGGYYIYSESLKEVSISGGFADIDPGRLVFLDKCRQLETIRLSHLQEWSIISIPMALREFCPNVTHFDWRKGSKRERDVSMAMLLSSTTVGWKRVELPDMQDFGPMAFDAFMKFAAETVEVLSVEGWGRIGHEEFLEILCTARTVDQNLRDAFRWLMGPKIGRAEVDIQKKEIIDLISSYLTPEELAVCLCVCKEWRDTLIPSLWRVVRVVNEAMYDRFRSKESRDALTMNSHHICVVETTDPAFAYFLATHCRQHTSNIQSLILRLRKEEIVQPPTTPPPRLNFSMSSPSSSSSQNDDHPAVIAPTIPETESSDRSAFATIVTQRLLFMNRNLRTLSLDEGCFRMKDGPDEFVKVMASAPTACLQRLEISFLGAQQRDDFVRGTPYDHDRQRTGWRSWFGVSTWRGFDSIGWTLWPHWPYRGFLSLRVPS